MDISLDSSTVTQLLFYVFLLNILAIIYFWLEFIISSSCTALIKHLNVRGKNPRRNQTVYNPLL